MRNSETDCPTSASIEGSLQKHCTESIANGPPAISNCCSKRLRTRSTQFKLCTDLLQARSQGSGLQLALAAAQWSLPTFALYAVLRQTHCALCELRQATSHSLLRSTQCKDSLVRHALLNQDLLFHVLSDETELCDAIRIKTAPGRSRRANPTTKRKPKHRKTR